MESLFEYSDILNSPIEAFYFTNETNKLPFKAHWHYFVEVLYVFDGEVNVVCNNTSFNLKSGEMIFLPARAVHGFNKVNENPYKFGILKFDVSRIVLPGDYLSKAMTVFRNPSLQEKFKISFTEEDFDDFNIGEFFQKCVLVNDAHEFGYDGLLYSGVSAFLIRILKYWHESGSQEQSMFYDDSYDYSINNILTYIDEHMNENLLVTDLADMCHMSYSYFARTFHKLYGRSCKEYIEFVRLCKVENLLLFTDYDLNYIGSETGFSDCSHLIRIFKRKYKVTPKQFRKQNKNGAGKGLN